jgi:glycosyltransferase involved in cell wall biosynthesis
MRLIHGSGAFAADWYLRTNPDVAAGGMDPLAHYVSQGAAENRDPSPAFSAALYRACHSGLPDRRNPLVDAIRNGRLADGRPKTAPHRTPPLDLAHIVFQATAVPRLAVVLDGRRGLDPLLPTLSVLAHEQNAIALEVLLLVSPASDIRLSGAKLIPAAADDTSAMARMVAACRAPCVLIPQPGVVPAPNAAEALVEAFAANPAAGLVCGKVLAPDNTVAHAGGTLMPDGKPWPRGAGRHAAHFAVASVAEVDIAPPGLLAVATAHLAACGGLGTQSEASWHAAADLALRMRATGATVLYQPFAEAFAANRMEEPNATAPAITPSRTPRRPAALFVDYQTPMPDRDSGSGDIYWLMRIMLGFGYDVTFLPAFSLVPAERYTEALRKLGIVCVASPDVPSPEAFLRAHAASFDVALLHRAPVAARFVGLLRQVAPRLRIVFNTVDLHFLREQRRAALPGMAGRKAEARATRKRELAVIRQADMTILLSPAEQAIIAAELPGAATRVIPVVREVPGLQAPLGRRRDVLFVGGFAHLPNVDAITHFTTACWPLVRARLPRVRLLVVGSSAPPEVLALANPAAGIDVLGYVEDLGALLRGCRLTVAPLRYGAGIKGKVVSSLAHGVPCVATPVAVEGMGITDGHEAMIADDPAAFAAAVVRVYEDDALWRTLSENGVALARTSFSVAHVTELMRALLTALSLPAGSR